MSKDDLLSRITVNPEICHGKPCIRGLRYPVEVILEYLAGGDTVEELLAQFPDLEREDVLACMEFSRRMLVAKKHSSGAFMKFLVDAHLPRGICTLLARHGHEAIHTLDLPDKNATSNALINQMSVDQQRVVVSKDADFFYSHLLQGRPWKLLLIRTGNISTRDLCSLLQAHLKAIEAALQIHTLVEIDRTTVTPLV